MTRSRLTIDTANPAEAEPGSDSRYSSPYFHIP
jgi:hypothetical protein